MTSLATTLPEEEPLKLSGSPTTMPVRLGQGYINVALARASFTAPKLARGPHGSFIEFRAKRYATRAVSDFNLMLMVKRTLTRTGFLYLI